MSKNGSMRRSFFSEESKKNDSACMCHVFMKSKEINSTMQYNNKSESIVVVIFIYVIRRQSSTVLHCFFNLRDYTIE